MEIGISTACFYPNLTENSVDFLGKNGIKNIEIFLNSQSETNVRFLSKVKRLADSYGINIIAVHSYFCSYEPYLIFSNYERRFDDCFPFVDSLFDAGAVLGAKYAIIHGGKISGGISNDAYFERFDILRRRGEELGVSLAQENVNLYLSSNPQFIADMKKALGNNVDFILDIKQCVRSGVEIDDMVNAMGDNLKHIHLSDHNGKSDCMLPFEGKFDFKAFLNKNETIKKATKMVEVYNWAYKNFDQVVAAAEKLNLL